MLGTKPVSSSRDGWTTADAERLFRIREWGADLFGVSANGSLAVNLPHDEAGTDRPEQVDLEHVLRLVREQGVRLPVLLRFPNLFAKRIADLHHSFQRAVTTHGYRGRYQGVFPIKVNQKNGVVRDAQRFGKAFGYGIEVGSKAELLAALSHLDNPDALLVCNGYKDPDYIRLALMARRAGVNTILVAEMPSELPAIVEIANELDIPPVLGLRYRLAKPGGGRWAASNGESGLFGLSGSEIVEAVDYLRGADALQHLQLLHFHQGSQLPELNGIRQGVHEAARVYVDLVREGAPLGILNLGGGLAIDYDGSATASEGSRNYSLDQYCDALVQTTLTVLDEASVPHPLLVTESGRAVCAHASALIFEVFETDEAEFGETPPVAGPDDHPRIAEIIEEILNCAREEPTRLQSLYNKCRGEAQDRFNLGEITLRQTSLVHLAYEFATHRIAPRKAPVASHGAAIPEILYGNFSVFQSLPDHWALGQLFPVVPIHRLDEPPERLVILADLTCDSDGKVKNYIHEEGAPALPAHDTVPGEPYYFGAFLVGAYQETLGDRHNLFGAPAVVEVVVEEGELAIRQIDPPESTADILRTVGYSEAELIERIRANASGAKGLDSGEMESYLSHVSDCLAADTYLASPSSTKSKP